MNPYPVITQKYTVPLAAKNKSVKTFNGLDHQYIPDKYLHHSEANMIFTMGEHPLCPLAFKQGHRQKIA